MAAVNNARALLIIDATYGSFAHYLQEFIPTPIIHHPQTSTEVPTTNKIAQELAKQMKKTALLLWVRNYLFFLTKRRLN